MLDQILQFLSAQARKLAVEKYIEYFKGRNEAGKELIENIEGLFEESEKGTKEVAKKRYSSGK